jgi:hypothetical protein
MERRFPYMLRLQGTVDKSGIVGCFERFCDLQRQVERTINEQWRFFPDDVRQACPVEGFHHHQRAAALEALEVVCGGQSRFCQGERARDRELGPDASDEAIIGVEPRG